MGNLKAFCLPRATQYLHPYIKVLQSVDTVLARMNCCDPPWDNGLGTQLNNTFTSISTKLK